MNKDVCAVIVTYNCEDEFFNTFDSVIGQVEKVVIVDNGSKTYTVNMLNNLKKKYDIELILCNENLGIAAALNRGVKYALKNNYEWIITLDHDSNLSGNMVENLLKAYDGLSSDKKLKVVSLLPNYIELGLNVDEQLLKNKEIVRDIEFGITSGNLVHRKAFEKVGMFDEKLFIDYVDYDFCFRIKENGYDIVEVSNALLFHKLGESREENFLGKKVSTTNHSKVRRYYMTRNRIYCWKKYKNIVPSAIKFDKKSAFKETIKIVLYEKEKYEKIKMILKGVRDNKKSKYGKYEI